MVVHLLFDISGLRWRLLDGSLINDTVINIKLEFGLGSWNWITISDRVRAKGHIVLLDHWPSNKRHLRLTLMLNIGEWLKALQWRTIVTGNGSNKNTKKDKDKKKEKVKERPITKTYKKGSKKRKRDNGFRSDENRLLKYSSRLVDRKTIVRLTLGSMSETIGSRST